MGGVSARSGGQTPLMIGPLPRLHRWALASLLTVLSVMFVLGALMAPSNALMG